MYQNKKVEGRSGCATLLYHRAAKCCSAPVQCLWQPGSAGPLRPHEWSFSPSVLQPSGVCVREHLCHDPVWSNLPYPCTMQQQHVKKLYWGKKHFFDSIMNCTVMHLKKKSKSPLIFLPGPNNSRFCEGKGKLSSTFNLTHPLPIQTLYVLRNVTAFASATAQLSKVSISPWEHQS